jgi:hypothetical protein
MKIQALAAALFAVSSAAHADNAEIRSMAFDTLKARFSYCTNLRADAGINAFTDQGALICTTLYSSPNYGRVIFWDPIEPRGAVRAFVIPGVLSFTQSGNYTVMQYISLKRFGNPAAWGDDECIDCPSRQMSENIYNGSGNAMAIVQDGVSIQARLAADEPGAVLIRAHNYSVERDSNGRVKPEAYGICRSLSRLSGPL